MITYERELTALFQQHMAPLLPFMADPTVQEIMVNSPDNVWIERRGEMTQLDVELSPSNLSGGLRTLSNLATKGRAPFIDARLPGYRFAAVHHPFAVHGDAIAIRKHSPTQLSVDDYLERGLLNRIPLPAELAAERPDPAAVAQGGRALADFLGWVMRSGANVLVSGGTSTGKTTFINALISQIRRERRLISIEDTRELELVHPNSVQFECNADMGFSMQDAVRLLMRFRPDQPVIGEVRDGTAYDYLDVLNTGHSGGICSIHADSDELALYRLEDLVRQSPKASTLPLGALRRKIGSAIHYVIQASRYRHERFPLSVLAVLGVDEQDRYQTQRLYHRFY
ncbi:CpaF family protein [Chitinimonas koreensis]|uniref:CpaF family protein n=1 Tax=Chitinimonas koreensis TaxID=356302 RepID=UPI00048F0227|nr:ATPase, T2SS/T4P/T4SS family [Chitinimonas koreensis]QNM95533.1 CpaF family protein [Chitinimonas koreensis]